MGKKKVIKNLHSESMYIESGLDLSKMSEKELYGVLNELYAYMDLDGVPIDFGNGLIDPSDLPKEERTGNESAYLDFSLATVYSYLGYDYWSGELYDDSYYGECDCFYCYEYPKVKKELNWKNHRSYGRKKRYYNLKKSRNIYKEPFFKKRFIAVDEELLNLINENDNFDIESLSLKSLEGKGYYKRYYQNKKKHLKKVSRKKVRNYLKNIENDLIGNEYKKVYDLPWELD